MTTAKAPIAMPYRDKGQWHPLASGRGVRPFPAHGQHGRSVIQHLDLAILIGARWGLISTHPSAPWSHVGTIQERHKMKVHNVVPMKVDSAILNEDIGIAHAGSAAYATTFTNKVTLGAISPNSPSIESHNGRLYIAWKGDGSNNINVTCSGDNGRTFGGIFNSPATSSQAPALCSHNDILFICWTCVKTFYLNVARVNLTGNSITGLSNKITLPFTSPVRPSLASFNSALYIAWKGARNDTFSLIYSNDSGATFGNKYDFSEDTTHGLGLAAHGRDLYIAWKGERNDRLNVARVQLSSDAIIGLSNKVILPDISPDSPSLLSLRERIYISWRGDVNKNLNIGCSINNGASFGNKYKSPEASRHAPALCAHNGVVFISWTGLESGYINIARVFTHLSTI